MTRLCGCPSLGQRLPVELCQIIGVWNFERVEDELAETVECHDEVVETLKDCLRPISDQRYAWDWDWNWEAHCRVHNDITRRYAYRLAVRYVLEDQ